MDLRLETRPETVNRVMLALLNYADNCERNYRSANITDEETAMWLIANADAVRAQILPTHLMTYFIELINDETLRLSGVMTRMNSLKQHLLQVQRQRQLQEQAVVVGGSRRQTNKFKHRKSMKTKSRRH
jgi:hypothetical protein